jgi:hypothetical protein
VRKILIAALVALALIGAGWKWGAAPAANANGWTWDSTGWTWDGTGDDGSAVPDGWTWD